MDSEKRSTIILLILALVGIAISFIYTLSATDVTTPTPPFGLPVPQYFLLVAFVIPMTGCIVTAVIMPRIIAPLFMRAKRITSRGFKDAYLPLERDTLSLKKWFGRAILTALLILGLVASVINVIDPRMFMTPADYTGFLDETGLPQFAPPVTISLAGFLAPVAFGLLSAAWAMEDSGLLHYRIPESKDKLYEIEPVYSRYSGYLKGFSGLSSIIFILSVFLLFFLNEGTFEPAIFTILIPMFSVLQTIPGYLVYSRLGTGFLTSGLPQAGHLNESDLGLSEAWTSSE